MAPVKYDNQGDAISREVFDGLAHDPEKPSFAKASAGATRPGLEVGDQSVSRQTCST
jgi:hypothetical protein